MDVAVIVVVVVLTALIFDFTNGFHDTANAMATSIATGALRPKVAAALAGCLNLAGAFLSVQVAKTISGGLVDETLINPVVIFAGLVGAILWNLTTWYLGLPSSSSHALFGGLIGATFVAGGADAIHFNTVLNKVILPALLSPVVAALIAMTVTYLALRIITRAKPGLARRGFKRGQTVSSSMLALAHGTNDAQKTMGVITLTLITSGLLAPGSAPPFWVVLSAGLAIGLGTYMGGWRIIRTLGRRVSDIQPVQGFAAETPAPRSSSPPPTSGFRCPPPRCAPARSSEPAPAAVWPRCTGGWPGGSRWVGASPCPRRPSWARPRPGWPRPAPSGSSSSRSPGWPWPPGSTPRRVAPS